MVGLCQVTSWLESSLFQALVRSVWGRASGIAKSIPQRMRKVTMESSTYDEDEEPEDDEGESPEPEGEDPSGSSNKPLFTPFRSSNTSVRLNTQRIPKSP